MYEHLLLFDGNCPVCHRVVRHVLEIDIEERFVFAPLESETARRTLKKNYADFLAANTVVVVENYLSSSSKKWIRSRAIFRIYWLIGGGWKVIGILSFFPGFIGNIFYRLFAIYRYQFNVKMPGSVIPGSRFLS